MPIFGLVKSFETMYQLDPTAMLYVLIKDTDMKFLHNLYSTQSLKFGIDICNSLETMRFSAT